MNLSEYNNKIHGYLNLKKGKLCHFFFFQETVGLELSIIGNCLILFVQYSMYTCAGWGLEEENGSLIITQTTVLIVFILSYSKNQQPPFRN